MRGHSRSKNGVASLAYEPRIHADRRANRERSMDCRVKPGNDEWWRRATLCVLMFCVLTWPVLLAW
jgi:hypothetical protein